MYLRISLVYFYLIFLLKSSEEIYQEAVAKYDWVKIRREVLRKFQNLRFLNTRERSVDFIKASQRTRTGEKVRRKIWEPGHKMWWDSNYKCMLAAHPYGKQDKHLDTEGYIYVCEGDDVEATDWEKAC